MNVALLSSVSESVDPLGFPHTLPPLWFTENVSREKYPESGSSLGENTLLMPEVREEWPDWIKMTEMCRVPLLSAKKQETEATVCTDSPNLDNGKLEKYGLVWRVTISAATLRW